MKLRYLAGLLAVAALTAFSYALPASADQIIQQPLTVDASATFNDHIATSNGNIPAVTGTGTPSIAAASSDTAGIVTAGASATSVVITFGDPYAAAPACVVGSQTQLAAFAYVTTAAAITITQTATSGNLINYVCMAVSGGL